MALLTCSRCNGSGYEGRKLCPQCRGMAFGMTHGPFFLYWGKRIDGFEFTVARLQRGADAVVNLLLFALFFGGLIAAAFSVLNAEPGTVLTTEYWDVPRGSSAFFALGVLAACVAYYRLVIASADHESVRHRAFGADESALTLPPEPETWKSIRSLPASVKIDVAKAYSAAALKAVEDAYDLARRLKHVELSPAHLFGGLAITGQVGVLFGRLGLQFGTLKDRIGKLLAGHPTGESPTTLAAAARQVLLEAYADAYAHRRPQVDAIDLFGVTVRGDAELGEILLDAGAELRKVENAVEWIRIQELLRSRYRRFVRAARRKPKSAMNRAMTAVATPFLDRIGQDVTRAAAYGQIAPVVGREKEIDAVLRVIEGGNRSVVLVGEPGVGKDAIVEALAQRMVEEDVPKILGDMRLVSVNVAMLVSGATASEAQERLLSALYEVGRSGNVVLVIPHVAGMVGITAGSGQGIDLAQTFAAELGKGYFFAITTATPKEYAQSIENSSLGQSLIKVDIGEPEIDEAVRILEAKSGSIEYRNNTFFSYDAIEATVTLSSRYMHEQFLPEKAIELAKEVASAVRKTKGKDALISREDVAALVSEKTKVPVTSLTTDESAKLLNLEGLMHGRVIGQDEAVKVVAAALRRARAEVRETGRPIANFLFLGPTGVGKTELAKTLAATYFGKENAMIRLDMSEYQDKPSLYKLIGEPAGRDSGGILSEAVRKNPFSLVLLDEIEKAHPDILNVFLQVMDDGRLTDNVGRTVDFTNAIVIMTSNAGAPFIQEEIIKGSSVEVIKERLLAGELKQHFRPEFLNRFDAAIVFRPLTEEEIRRIAGLMLAKVADRLKEKGIEFEATPEAVAELAKAGYDPMFGARPLRRVIQERVDNTIADALLRGDVKRRDKIIFDVGGQVRIEKKS
ncbi:AAA family ATPase [Candidatus Uhrbacteria bacterium]|nr:AAA family ATPase [Candidatus Uhrbacteria bacterium]